MTILDEIAEKTRQRIAERKRRIPLEEIRREAEGMELDTGFPFEQALKRKGMAFICEVKKASPSKGVIAAEFPYLQIAREYEQAGASAISCLTEPFYFQGRDAYLQEIAAHVSVPVLRKDFTVDPYMIYEAKILGAAAVLLICALLTDEQLKEYLIITKKLGLSALVEVHTEEEVKRALKSGAEIIGVNNRNLKTFQVDITTSKRLRNMVPDDYIFVSESGIRNERDLEELYENGTDAVLIGEMLMRASDKKMTLQGLKRKFNDESNLSGTYTEKRKKG